MLRSCDISFHRIHGNVRLLGDLRKILSRELLALVELLCRIIGRFNGGIVSELLPSLLRHRLPSRRRELAILSGKLTEFSSKVFKLLHRKELFKGLIRDRPAHRLDELYYGILGDTEIFLQRPERRNLLLDSLIFGKEAIKLLLLLDIAAERIRQLLQFRGKILQ